MTIELPQLSLEQKWKITESNLIYFITCGISYAKSHGGTAEDFGTWAGQIAAPSWDEEKSKGAHGLVEGIVSNKQQFHNFEIEILNESETMIQARMKGFGEDQIRRRPRHEITEDDYIQFFNKKWTAIADHLGLEYNQKVEGEWVIFFVSGKK
jgi:hypothetical protein